MDTMDIVCKDSFCRNLLAGFLVVAVFAFHRKLFRRFSKKSRLLSYLSKLKNGMKPVFSFDPKSTDIAKYGVTSPEDAWTRENPRCLSPYEHALDSINVWGADNSGNVLMLRVARRHDRKSEVWIYLRLESGEEFQTPILPELHVFDTDGKSFSAKGLYFEVLEPLRRIRIGFNGQLRKCAKNQYSENNDCIDVQFNFIWHPLYGYSAYPLDFNPSLFAAALSKQKCIKEFLESRSIFPTEWHEQWGQMYGPVTVDRKQYTLMLTGTKTREHGVLNWGAVNRRVVIKGFDTIGTGVTLYGESDEDGSINIYHGQVAPPSNMGLYSVSECNIDRAEGFFVDTTDEFHNDINVNLVADTLPYNIKLETKGPGFEFFAGEDWEVKGSCRLIKLTINGREGFALVESYEKNTDGSQGVRQRSSAHLKEPEIATTEKLVVAFTEDICQSSKLVGGKGSSLALMTSLTSNESDVRVPPGLCLTKTSFELHLTEHPAIEKAIRDLQDVAWKRKLGTLTEKCARVDELIRNSSLSQNLQDKLEASLRQAFGNNLDGVKLAVRSSAIGEDSEEMSAAGQNETFLGVKGFEKVCEAVLKCWASQFAYRSVEYKRQNGQLMNGGMGVVIQEMVPAEVAGVLFSKDPTNGSVARMAISANYGLGESVVSAIADPDTIMLNRTWDDQVSVADKIIGKKEMKTIMSDDGGIVETKNEDNKAGEFTVSDALALRLGKIAIELEKAFGSARDIEWAVQQDKIYLLQARPVTSDSVLTDFEVLHEFDSPFRTTSEQLTTGNVAEVMPGAISPLSLSCNARVTLTQLDVVFNGKTDKTRYDPSAIGFNVYYTSHVFVDMIQQKRMHVEEKERSILSKALDVGMFGKVLDDTEIMRMARERFEKASRELKWLMMSLSITGMLKGNKVVSASETKYRNYPTIAADATKPQEAYEKISAKLLDINEGMLAHIEVTIGSMLWNNVMLIALAGSSGEFTPDHYSDVAAIIGSSIGAESGDVPLSLQKIAASISEEFDTKEFSILKPQEALDLLQTSSTNASKLFQNFFARHGHRGMKEFDVISTSWGMNPLGVVKILQGMTKHPIPFSKKESASASDIIQSLKTPLSPLKKKLLSWLLTRSRNAVCYRERAKSMVINHTNCLRLSFRNLAKLMVEHGNLPDADLMFFMTFGEIGELIKTRSARIIMRARRRMRQYPYMDALMYPEHVVGVPKPVNEDSQEEIPEGTMQVEGLPVSQGRVVGLARVITFDEVDSIEPKDILITHATDIGWSPYFPILGGVVTEIGGLVSHGAVVAREYGLPCVISAVNATKVFKTGDRVLLDATIGMITKLADDNAEQEM